MDERRVFVRRSRTDVVGGPRPMADESVVQESIRHSPSGAEIARRVVVFLFGIVQLLIGLRIVLSLLGAVRANDLVRGIYEVSAVFVAPFEGILRTESVGSGASVLDVTAIVALVGWTVLELIIVAAIAIARREP